MATSGTFDFSPSMGELTLFSFNLAGIRNTEIIQEHMISARMASNLMLGRWSSMPGVNTWAVDLQTIALIPGVGTYTIPSNTITMLDAYVVQNQGGSAINRIILPISRSEYASYPNPNQVGETTVFWYDKLLAPTVTLWPVPDDSLSELQYYRMRQIQDSNFTNGQQIEIPYYWLEAYALGLAWRLAMIWKPEKAAGLKTLADDAYQVAADQNTEVSAFYISPMLAGYYSP